MFGVSSSVKRKRKDKTMKNLFRYKVCCAFYYTAAGSWIDGWMDGLAIGYPTTTRRSWRHRISSHHFFINFFFSSSSFIFPYSFADIFFSILSFSLFVAASALIYLLQAALLLLPLAWKSIYIYVWWEHRKKYVTCPFFFLPYSSGLFFLLLFKPKYIEEYIRERKAGADERIRTMACTHTECCV